MLKKLIHVFKSKENETLTLHDLKNHLDLRLNEISSQVRELDLGLQQLETKLLTKDLRDKQAFGSLYYKLHESKSTKVENEIQDLESKLKQHLTKENQ